VNIPICGHKINGLKFPSTVSRPFQSHQARLRFKPLLASGRTGKRKSNEEQDKTHRFHAGFQAHSPRMAESYTGSPWFDEKWPGDHPKIPKIL